MSSQVARWGGLAAALVLYLFVGLGAGTAAADQPGESDEARVLVQQAIALMVNTPDDKMAIGERVEDALAAPHKEGVDLARVGQAQEALADGDTRRARALLQEAIGAGPFLADGTPWRIRETTGEPGAPAFAVRGETGTSVILDEYDPGRRLDGGERLLLVLSGAAVVGGLVLAWRWRPPESIRALRRMPRQTEA
jgi:hypothetical protein